MRNPTMKVLPFALAAMLAANIACGTQRSGSGAQQGTETHAAASDAPYAGIFSNDAVWLELKREAGGYAGTIAYNGKEYPLHAKETGSGLEGSFDADGRSFAFNAALSGTTLTFGTEGETYKLERKQSASPSGNPLGRAAHASAGAAGATSATRASGATSAAHANIHRHPAGLVFEMPEKWKAVDSQGGSAVVPPGSSFDPARADNAEVYNVSGSTHYDSPNDPDLLSELKQTLTAGGVQSVHESGKQAFQAKAGEGVVSTLDGTTPANKAIRVRAYIVPSLGGVLYIVASGEPTLLDKQDTALRGIAATLTYDPSAARKAGAGEAGSGSGAGKAAGQAGALSDGNPQSDQWVNHVGGKLLTQMDSYNSGGGGGGYNSTTKVYLAPNGTFEYYSSSSVSVYTDDATGGSGGQNNATGRWKIVTRDGTTYLALTFDNGQTASWRMEFENGKTFANGTRTYVTDR